MLGRFLEDGYVLGRFIYFYAKAPQKMKRLGFAQPQELPRKDRMRWAWHMTTGGGSRQ